MVILSESTQEIPTSIRYILVPFVFVAAITAIVLLLYEYYELGLVFMIIMIALFVVIEDFCTEPHRKIKVILQDDYPVVELLDKYTVDGNEGEIWTIIEREPMRKQKDEE